MQIINKRYGELRVISFILPLVHREIMLIIIPSEFSFAMTISENLQTQWDEYSGPARTAYHWEVQII